MNTRFATLADLEKQRAQTGKAYREFLRVPAMSAGWYVLAAGTADLQSPHHEDELYYVVRGKARFRAGEEDLMVSTGSVMFVAAKVETGFTTSRRNWPYWFSSRRRKADSFRLEFSRDSLRG